MGLDSYTGNVAKLLDCGANLGNYRPESWANYPEQFGLTAADIPELIRMACDPLFDTLDPNKTEAAWAPIHAVRALGQLRAEAAIAPLLKLLRQDDDSFHESVPQAIGLIGPSAIEPTAKYLCDPRYDDETRNFCMACVEAIALNHPEHRQACIELLVSELEKYDRRKDDFLDSALIGTLVELKATEAAPLIEAVFSRKPLDEFISGSWPAVQVDLGLKQKSDFTPEELQPYRPWQVEPRKEQSKPREALPQFKASSSKAVQGFGGAKKSSKKKR